MDTTEKTCSRCGETKPLDDFPRNRSRRDGLNPWCRECGRRYRAAVKERTAAGEAPPLPRTCTRCGTEKHTSEFARDVSRVGGIRPECKACRAADRRKSRTSRQTEEAAVRRAWRAQHRDKINAQKRERRAANIEHHREQQRASRARRVERARAQSRASYRRHLDRRRAYHREYDRRSREQRRAAHREYMQTPDGRAAKRAGNARRRSRKRSRDCGCATALAVDVLLGLGPCIYCGEPAEHLEHVVALAAGGWHCLENLAPACARCNLRKGAGTVEDLAERLRADGVEPLVATTEDALADALPCPFDLIDEPDLALP